MSAVRALSLKRHSRRRSAASRKRSSLEQLEHRLALSAVAWTGPSSGSWDVAGNWSSGAVPTAGDDVTIDTAAALTISIQPGDSIAVRSLTTGANDTLSISGGSLTVTGGSSTLNGPLDMTGGTLTADGASLIANAATSISAANLYAESGGTLSLPDLSTYTSNGNTLEATGAGSSLDLPALTTITHNGPLILNAFSGGKVGLSSLASLDGGNAAGLAINDTGGGTILDGNLTNLNFVNVTLDGTDTQVAAPWTAVTNSQLTISGGTYNLPLLTSLGGTNLSLSGGAALTLPAANIDATSSVTVAGAASLTTTGDLTNNGTLTVGPGSTVNVGGNFTQGAGGTLSVELGGAPASGQFGQVLVQNAASLAGALNVSAANGYAPQVGDEFTVMKFASVSNESARLTGLGASLVEETLPTSLELSVPPPDVVQSAAGATLHTSIGSSFYTTVATFTDLSPFANANDFVAAIDWGDGTASNSNIGSSGSQFQVNWFHDYAHSGTYATTITIVEHGVATTTTGTVIVAPWANGTINVTTSNDTHAADAAASPVDADGNISLRSAIEYLNATDQGNVTVLFDGNRVRGPVQLTLGPLEIDDSLTMDGRNVYQLAIDQATAGAAQFFQIDKTDAGHNAVAVTIANLTFNLGALAPNNTAAIENLGGLTLQGVNFTALLANPPATGDAENFITGGGSLTGPVEINGETVNATDDVGLNQGANRYPFKAGNLSDSLVVTFDSNPTIGPDASSSPSGHLIAVGQSVPVPASDVVADWRFQEGSAGQPAGGPIIDSSGQGANGTAFNGPTYSSNVPFATVPQTGQADNMSLSFNGVNQRVFVPDSPSFALTHSLTVEALVDVTGSQGGYVLFRGDNRGGLDPYTLSIQGSGSNLYANFSINNAANAWAGVSAPIAGPNQWLDLVGTLDDATGIMRLYINGAQVASTVTSVRPFATLDPSQQPGLGIGSLQSGAGNFFQGLINEVRICDVALTPDQFLDSTPGNFVVTDNGSLLLNEPSAELNSLTFDGSGGGATFAVPANPTVPITVHGGAANDTLVLPQSGRLLTTFDAAGGYSGTWSNAGSQPITFDGIQTLEQKLGPLPANAEYVTAVYHDVLGRAPDAAGLKYWTGLLDNGVAIGSVAEAIAHSPEYYANFVVKPDFSHLLGRAASDADVTFWTAQMTAGLTDRQLEANLVASDEFFAKAGGANADWLDAVYQAVLGRAAGTGDAKYWLGQLSGGASRLTVAEFIADSAENGAQLIKNDYFQYLGRAADDAGLAYWIEQLSAGRTNEDIIANFTASAEYYGEHSA